MHVTDFEISDSGGADRPQASPAAWSGLALLTLLNLVNFLDRQVLPATFEDVKAGLALTDQQMGLLGTSFLLVIIVASPVFGYLGDRRPRMKLIALGAAVWSAATVASGLATSFAHLLLARIAVGSGEAAYGTIAPSLLGDLFGPRLRGRVFAGFYAALPVGAALGFTLGGTLARHYGWRSAFLVTGLPGLALALWSWLSMEPVRGGYDSPSPEMSQARNAPSASDELEAAGGVGRAQESVEAPQAPQTAQDSGPAETAPRNGLETWLALLRNHAYLRTVFGYAMQTFAVGGLGFWAPAFLSRVRGLERTHAAIEFGLTVALGGLIGGLAGGWLADAGLRRSRNAYLWVSGVSTLLAVPFCLGALVLPSHLAYMGCIFVAVTLLFASTGPINALLVTLVEANMRASAVAAATVAIHLLGDAPANLCIGFLSDRQALHMLSQGMTPEKAAQMGLSHAILLLPVAVLLAALVWLDAARRLDAAPPGGAASRVGKD